MPIGIDPFAKTNNTRNSNDPFGGGSGSLAGTLTSSSSRVGNDPFATKSSPKVDLSSSAGLYAVAQGAGGAVAQKAEDIVHPENSLMNKITDTFKISIGTALDILSRPNFAIASAVKNAIDKDPTTGVVGGLYSGITGKTKHTFSDVFTEAGWNPETKVGKVAKFATSFAADVLLDPTTYITFGESVGAKVLTQVGERTLTKEGAAMVAKGLALDSGKQFGEDYVKKAVANMAINSPELYAQFLDKGGIKFFGQSIISGGRIKAVTELIPGITLIDEKTAPVRNAIGALFSRNVSAKYGKLPTEYIDLRQKFSDLGKVKSTDAIDEVVNIAKANNLTYDEMKIISNAMETKLPLADERLSNAANLFGKILKRNLKDEQMRGIKVGELPNYVPHILVDEPVKQFNFVPEGAKVSLGAAKSRKIEGTIEEINEAFGKDFFDANVVNAIATRSLASNRATTASDFLREAGQRFGALADRAPSNYVEVTSPELKGLKFHPAIAESIDGFKKGFINDEATNKLLRTFDKAQNFWKASITSIFPAFHGRNAVSNVLQNFLDLGVSAIDPRQHMVAGHLMNQEREIKKLEQLIAGTGEMASNATKKLQGILDEKVLTDSFGKEWNLGEIRQAITENRVAFGSDFLGFLDIPETMSKKLNQAGGSPSDVFKSTLEKVNPLSTENIAFTLGRKTANIIEQQARILNFVTNLQRTGDVNTAAKRTKQFLFDYQNLSDFEKNVMRRLVPFYTFTRKNIELQATQVFKQPGKFATQAKLFSNISKAISGATLTDEERTNLPDFLKNGLGIVYSKEGDNIEIIGNLGTPFEQVFQAVQKNQILGGLSPVIALPLQKALNRSFFKITVDGKLKALDEDTDASAFKEFPQFIKDYIGFTVRKNKDGSERYVSLNPMRMFIINNMPPTTRVLSSVRQLEQSNVSGHLKVLQQLIGVRPYQTNTELNEAAQEKQKVRALQDTLDQSGVAPIFQKSFIPSKNPKK